MVVDILVNGADPATTPVQTMNNGIATINTDTAAKTWPGLQHVC